jgi:hypothetical protein
MMNKLRAYEQHGVEEVYYYDPQTGQLQAWIRREGRLTPVEQVHGFESPRLKIRFRPGQPDMRVERPDGSAFESFNELAEQVRAERERVRQEQALAQRERERADRLAAKLRALGVDPDATG